MLENYLKNTSGREDDRHEHLRGLNLAYVRGGSNSTVKTAVAIGLALLAAKHIGSGCGILMAGARGGNRPYTYAILGVSRGVFTEAMAEWSGDLAKVDEQATSTPLVQAIKNLGASIVSLPTGSKLCSAMLASSVGRPYCMVLLCVAVARSGRARVFPTTFITRAATALRHSVDMTRGLMTKLALSAQFNGVAALALEVGLVIAASSGTQTSSLQTLAMTSSQRQDLASELESTIGAGGSRNRAIIQDQAKSATNMLAYGFSGIANELFPGVDRTFISMV